MFTSRALCGLCCLVGVTSAAAFGSSLIVDREMTVSALTVVNQIPGPGFTDVEITGDLVNTASGLWLEVKADLVPDTDAFPGIVVFQPTLRAGPIDAFGVEASVQLMSVQVPDAVLASFLAAVVADELDFDFDGDPESLYTAPPAFVDEPTDDAFLLSEPDGGDTRLVFCAHTGVLDDLDPGDLMLVADDGYQPESLDPALLPGDVQNVSNLVAQIHCPSLPEVHVTLRSLTDITDVLESGILSVEQRSIPVVGATLSDDQYAPLINACDGSEPPGACTESHPAFPVRFNELDLGQGLTLSGEVQLSFSVTALEISIRNATLDRVVTRIETGWTASMTLEASQEVSTGDEISLFSIGIPIGSAAIPPPATPIFEIGLAAGGEATLTAAGVVGIHGGTSAGVEMVFENGAWESNSWTEPVPAALSPPQLTDAAVADARAYLALDLSFQLGGVFGPLVRTEGFGELRVQPTQEPWWSIDIGVAQEAGTRLDYFGVDVDWTAPVWERRWTVLDSDDTAGWELPGGPRTSGEDVRWAAAYGDGIGVGTFESLGIAALADGGALVWGKKGQAGFVTRLDAVGELLWVARNAPGSGGFPVEAVELPDGSFLVTGQYNTHLWLARFGDNGVVLDAWAGQCDMSCGIEDMALGDDGNGTPLAAITGTLSAGSVDKDAFVMLFDADPDLTNWDLLEARAYRLNEPGASRNNDWPHGIAGLAGGGFVVVGETDADVGVDQIQQNFMIFAVDGAANLEWATAIASTRGHSFEDVEQGPEGTIYAVGRVARAINDDYPAATVARIQPDGSDFHQVLIAEENAAWLEQHLLVTDTSPPTAGGDTSNDRAFEVVATASGPVVVGRTGGSSDTAAWMFQLDPNLGAQWLTVFDGPMSEEFLAGGGDQDGRNWTYAVGESTSWVPEGVGGDSALVVFKVPREGILRFDEEIAGNTRYLQPRVESASGPHFVADDGAGGFIRTQSIPFVEEALAVNPGTPPADFVLESLVRYPLATPDFPAPAPIFEDGFDWGDANAWSAAMP